MNELKEININETPLNALKEI